MQICYRSLLNMTPLFQRLSETPLFVPEFENPSEDPEYEIIVFGLCLNVNYFLGVWLERVPRRIWARVPAPTQTELVRSFARQFGRQSEWDWRDITTVLAELCVISSGIREHQSLCFGAATRSKLDVAICGRIHFPVSNAVDDFLSCHGAAFDHKIKAGYGNRTRLAGLGSQSITTMLIPHGKEIG